MLRRRLRDAVARSPVPRAPPTLDKAAELRMYRGYPIGRAVSQPITEPALRARNLHVSFGVTFRDCPCLSEKILNIPVCQVRLFGDIPKRF